MEQVALVKKLLVFSIKSMKKILNDKIWPAVLSEVQKAINNRSEKNLLTERSDISKHSNKVLYSPYQDAKLLCSPYQENKKHTISPDHHEVSSSCSPVRKSSKSIKSRKSISPLQKDKENIECNFKDVYRKMLMKNLKAKSKINDA